MKLKLAMIKHFASLVVAAAVLAGSARPIELHNDTDGRGPTQISAAAAAHTSAATYLAQDNLELVEPSSPPQDDSSMLA